MTTKKGDFKKLAASKEMQMSMMTQKQIAERTATLQEKSERWQRKIMELTKSMLLTMILFPAKLLNGIIEIAKYVFPGLKGVDALLKATGVISKTGGPIENIAEKFDESASQTWKLLKEMGVLFEGAVKPVVEAKDKAFGNKHYGGLLKANELSRLQFGEMANIGKDEFLFASNQPARITPKYEMAERLATGGEAGEMITTSGSTTYINITVPSSNPDEVADALRQHLARIS
jgi:hypothetical protein